MANKELSLVSAEEEQEVGRALLVWLNKCPDKPVGKINFEFIPQDNAGMMMSTIQATLKTREYIFGGYEAQYQFALIYRIKSGGNDDRLSANEALNAIGAWAERNPEKPDLGNAVVRSVRRTSNASLLAVYEDGSRDHQILMNLTYEVN